ncbi:MAG: ribonuclease III [Deltaproteobacteria bacterium]|nr:MAG: ribonuclease III [Deltaproteobacteria bacterium]
MRTPSSTRSPARATRSRQSRSGGRATPVRSPLRTSASPPSSESATRSGRRSPSATRSSTPNCARSTPSSRPSNAGPATCASRWPRCAPPSTTSRPGSPGRSAGSTRSTGGKTRARSKRGWRPFAPSATRSPPRSRRSRRNWTTSSRASPSWPASAKPSTAGARRPATPKTGRRRARPTRSRRSAPARRWNAPRWTTATANGTTRCWRSARRSTWTGRRATRRGWPAPTSTPSPSRRSSGARSSCRRSCRASTGPRSRAACCGWRWPPPRPPCRSGSRCGDAAWRRGAPSPPRAGAGSRYSLPVTGASDLSALERRLGYRFRDRALLVRAVTHRSFANEHPDAGGDNERLEFLGDAVLDLVVGEQLMARHPDLHEGDLSMLRASIVSEAGLSAIARDLGLGDHLRLGRGEERSGGRDKPSLLADALEAVVAAIYRDGGFDRAAEVVARLFAGAIAGAVATEPPDYKTRLQEWSQARFKVPPEYEVVAERGPDHDKTFRVDVRLRGRVLATGEGRSKKEAEQAAARAALANVDAGD